MSEQQPASPPERPEQEKVQSAPAARPLSSFARRDVRCTVARVRNR